MAKGKAVKLTFGQLPIGQTFDWMKSETEDSRSSFLNGPMRKTGERTYIDETSDEYEVGELWAVTYHVGRDFQLREKPDESKEMPKKVDLDRLLLRSTVWRKDFVLPPNPSQEVIAFSKLSKRKKLLALIALTYPANRSFPSILETSCGSGVPSYAWSSLNRLVKGGTPVSQLLENEHITPAVRAVILAARDAGRCKDEFMTVFASPESRKASLAIAQYGSWRQRICLVDPINSADALSLVSRSDPAFVEKCIDWARSVESGSTESLKRENNAIRKAVSDAARVEAKRQPFRLSGRGHEPRVTLDRRLASILRGQNIPCVHISGYGANYRYPRRIFATAIQLLKKRLGATLIAIYQGSAYRVDVS